MGSNAELAFFDADAFDSSLSNDFASDAQQVHVTFAGTTSINAMPPRINAWLTAIQKSDGEVKAKDPNNPQRGFLDLGMITGIFDLFQWYHERKERQARFDRVRNYNATVLFDSQGGQVKEIVFQRR